MITNLQIFSELYTYQMTKQYKLETKWKHCTNKFKSKEYTMRKYFRL